MWSRIISRRWKEWKQRLDIVTDPAGEDTSGEPKSPTHDLPALVTDDSKTGTKHEVIKVQERERFLAWVELLSRPILRKTERLEITAQMKDALLGASAPAWLKRR